MSRLNFYLNILSCQSENVLASTPDLVLIAHVQKHPLTGFPQSLEIMGNLENRKKSSMHGKIMEFEKT